MSQGILRLRLDGPEPDIYEAQINTWDNPDGGALYEIHFSGVCEEGAFTGSCELEQVSKWKYKGNGRMRDASSGEVFESTINAQLKLVGKLLVLEGHWLDDGDPDAFDLYIEIENR